MDTKKEIIHLFQNALQFNRKDVLVHLPHPHQLNWDAQQNESKVPFDKIIHKYFLEAKQVEQERGAFPFCLGYGLLRWTWKDSEIQSPLFLSSCLLTFQKVDQTFLLQNSEEWFLNPFLSKHFNLQVENGSLETVQKAWEEHLSTFELETSTESSFFCGNFHYHRFDLWKELDGLLLEDLNPNLDLVLHGEKKPSVGLPFREAQLFLLDHDQKRIQNAIQQESLVVQGPPGTGKSQIITQIMSAILRSDYKGLIVSEKQAALKVLVQKMRHFQLSPFIHLIHDAQSAKHFVEDLKETWDYLENGNFQEPNEVSLRKAYEQQMEQMVYVLKHPTILGGIDFQTFQKYTRNSDWDKATYVSQMPDLVNWESTKETLQSLFELNLQNSLSLFKVAFWETEQYTNFDVKLRTFANDWAILSKTLEIDTLKAFEEGFKSAILFNDLSNKLLNRYPWAVNLDATKSKKIQSLYKHFLQWEKSHNALLQQDIQWLKNPSILEINYFLTNFEKGSFFTRRKLKKWWKSVSNAPLEISVHSLTTQLELYAKAQEFEQLKIQLAEWQIYEPNQEFPVLLNFIAHTDLNALKALKSMSEERKTALREFSQQFEEWQQIFRAYFQFKPDTIILDFFEEALQKWEHVVAFSQQWMTVKKYMNTLPLAQNFKEYESLMLKSTWVKFIQHYPNLANFNPNVLVEKAAQIDQASMVEQRIVVQMIQHQHHQKFQQYHKLVQSPAARLSPSEKELRQKLKNGKAVLVKAFKKSRQFPSIRSLYSGDAKLWIDVMKPIVLGNTTQIARHLPISLRCDFSIFDEAGQIPLVNALGTLQRGQRVLIAGDTQQMSPSTFFQGSQNEQVDLLHQSVYYLPQYHLRQHYRSKHPALIAFSNRHFYENQLQVYPSYPPNKQAVKGVFVKEGIYEEGLNTNEAKAIAHDFSKALNQKASLGLVAMSEHQLAAIWKHLAENAKQLVASRIEEGTCFFKTLEQVQGDECDHLWISFGYGKNAEGQFHQRFGPINLSTGPKRLNVLFSRAKEQIYFYHSVHSSDFQLSSNEGTQLCMKFLHALELQEAQKEGLQLPFGFRGEAQAQKLLLHFDFQQIESATQLTSHLLTLSKRGWDLEVRLS
jgi:hypothetical protein